MVANSKIKLDKKDHLRALLTDTAPSDVPIVFSNDGFYINSQRVKIDAEDELTQLIKLLYRVIIKPDVQYQYDQSHPHKYKIRKNDVSLRTLCLLHPRSQNNIVEFYAEWNESITYLCSLSPLSIRVPIKVGNSFYSKSRSDSANKYKEVSIDTLESELVNKHASSFFAYRGVNRIYKIFSQKSYLSLEKKYPIMWLVDISNCFPSIYTHSISWAIKNKEFVKSYVRHSNQFCQKFDTLMQRCNNNETNGIPVGAEISRIFAEIILQSIDLKFIDILMTKYNLELDIDYCVLRYVDDYMIFSKNEKSIEIISNVISDTLGEYSLYINENKLKKYNRPLCTEKTSTIIGLDEIIKDLEQNLFNKINNKNGNVYYPKDIFNRHRFSQAFINKIKRLCVSNNDGYSDVSAYLISVCHIRIERLINSTSNYTQDELSDHDLNIRVAITILMDIMFFFYSVYATISASNRLSKTIIIVDEFYSNLYPKFLPYYRTEVMDNINQLTLDRSKKDNREGYISLERLNILLATVGFGKNYLVSSSYFDALLEHPTDVRYFNIISLLYYFKSYEQYSHLVKTLEHIIKQKFNDDFDLKKNSEKAHLFLDLLSCPFVSTAFKLDLLKIFYSVYYSDISITNSELEDKLSLLNQTYWFIKWEGLNLLKQLERKELNSVY